MNKASGSMTLNLYAPALVEEWDYELNEYGPDAYSPHSNKIVHWKCKKNHTWQAKINNRVTNETRCPYCAHRLPWPGETDLKTLFPNIAAEWHPDKNLGATPDQFLPKSSRYAWWKCRHGHEWKTKICHRTEGRGCPVCAGNKVFPGLNDLKTLFPEVANLWDSNKNDTRSPENVTAHSHFRAHWKCPEGHSWTATVSTVVFSYQLNNQRTGCPYCAGKKVFHENSLRYLFPDLAEEWDYSLNTAISPDEVTAFSHKKAWWKCGQCGFQWQAQIGNRAAGCGCPKCSHTVVSELNSLALQAPELAADWDYLKNAPLTPDDVAVQSNLVFWWICEKEHSWRATVSNRSALKKGCPYCTNKLPIVGETDFASQYPFLLEEWAYDKNTAKPTEYLPGSQQKVWWRCKEGHEWKASIFSIVNGAKCPTCRNLKQYKRQC